MELIDSHSHIYVNEFDTDRAAMLKRASDQGVKNVLMPAIDSSTHTAMLQAEKEFPEQCKSMIGLHPCSVKENYKDEMKIVEEYLSQRKFVAVGETGLDFYWDLTFKEQQYSAFDQQIKWAIEYDTPVVIHSRNSTDECIEMIKQNQDGKLKGVFHCFSGNTEQAKKIIDLGFYLGIGGVLTFKNSGLDAVIKNFDLNNIVLETDAPYLAPVPFRGKRNESSYLKYVVQKLAEIKEMDVEKVSEQTTLNAKKLFGL